MRHRDGNVIRVRCGTFHGLSADTMELGMLSPLCQSIAGLDLLSDKTRLQNNLSEQHTRLVNHRPCSSRWMVHRSL